MRKLLLVIFGVAIIGYVWSHRQTLFHDAESDSQSLRDINGALPQATRAAEREKARVDESMAVESAAEGESVKEGMSKNDVRQMLGDPASVDRLRNGDVVWHYPAISKKVLFRHGMAWSVETDESD